MDAEKDPQPGATSAREAISKLTPAQKGSLGECYFLDKLCPGARRISHIGVRADVRLPDGTIIDIKLHRNLPDNRSKVIWYWIDYLSKHAIAEGRTTIWRVLKDRPKEATEFTFSNAEFEAYYGKWKTDRPRSRTPDRAMGRNTAKEKVLAEAKQKVQELLPQYPTLRFLVRQASTTKALTVAPAIYSRNAIRKAPKGATIVLVGDDEWNAVTDYWVFDHKTPLESILPFMENVEEERPDIGWRFKQGAFPLEWRHTL